MKDISDLRIKEMECDGKPVPEKYIACFNTYIEKVIGIEYNAIKEELKYKTYKLEDIVEGMWNRKWANKYFEMRRKEQPRLLFPDSDEVYQRYFEQKEEIEHLNKRLEDCKENATNIGNEYACDELSEVNGILTDTIIEVTENEMDNNKLCYLEEISSKFGEKIENRISEIGLAKGYKRRYRVIKNKNYTKNNYELPYTIVEVDYDPDTNKIREVGSKVWTEHCCDLFDERRRVEVHFAGLISNTFVASLKNEIKEMEEEKLAYVKGSFIDGNNKCGKCGFYIGGRPDFQPRYCHCCGSKLNWYAVKDFELAYKRQNNE